MNYLYKILTYYYYIDNESVVVLLTFSNCISFQVIILLITVMYYKDEYNGK